MASYAEAVASVVPPPPSTYVDEARGEEKLAIAIDVAMLPLRLRLARRLTDDELARFCGAENGNLRIEMEPDGELLIMSPTHSDTGNTNFDLSVLFGIWVRQTKTGKGFDSSTGFTLPDGSKRSPDAAWVSLERWDALTAKERRSYAPICPEFIVELVSATDPIVEVRSKMKQWMANGVQFAWMIDPDERLVEVYRQGQDEPEILNNPATIAGEGPVAGFVLQLDEIWG